MFYPRKCGMTCSVSSYFDLTASRMKLLLFVFSQRQNQVVGFSCKKSLKKKGTKAGKAICALYRDLASQE